MELTSDMKRAAEMGRSLAKMNTKFLETHVGNSKMLLGAALDFLEQYTGSFNMLVDMKSRLDYFRQRGMSPRQIAAVINCMMQDVLREDRRLAAAREEIDFSQIAEPLRPIDIELPAVDISDHVPTFTEAGVEEPVAVREGKYTVAFEGADHVTLRVKVTTFGDFEEGTMTVAFLAGGDNQRDYVGFAFVTPKGEIKVWSRYRRGYERQVEALKIILGADDQTVYGKAYAMISGCCWRCGRELTTPESIEAGIGPICAGNL